MKSLFFKTKIHTNTANILKSKANLPVSTPYISTAYVVSFVLMEDLFDLDFFFSIEAAVLILLPIGIAETKWLWIRLIKNLSQHPALDNLYIDYKVQKNTVYRWVVTVSLLLS